MSAGARRESMWGRVWVQGWTGRRDLCDLHGGRSSEKVGKSLVRWPSEDASIQPSILS